MHSFKTIAAAALLVIGVSAQEYYIRPDSVDIGIRSTYTRLLAMREQNFGTQYSASIS